ncbi:hypothetical protein IAQ61_004561 [Plenodomus lingam]|uniref:Similar to cytochrome P450 monooxygenase n=1 Tax=Leptosphaeria maculans (strain JN3 / isolate v23.1.3 / race Av1-4-5-6-7-8) TaxID=985895 RepID=E4ZVV2_LEPMJ|nr:similar to cytochrome P450 monooxygenase [Plenodomus lingam JN3]KAH9873934.1 hypothetical protein IAQ61_004561 [Plenodomus lingam]CBX95728.1 similar to cytochrome P450 monooxygenase [Plenodomus lingam JN3]
MNISPLLLFTWLLGSWIIWYTTITVRRLFFHPLAKIPGPKLAAVTLLYQTWYCFVGGSRFYIKIQKLHEQYGPVVRIGPDEVHLSDAANYDKINRVGTKFSKDGAFYGAFGNPNSSFTTASNELHRLRRGGLNSFFSRKVVLQLEDIVHEKTELLIALVRKTFDKGGEFDIHHGLRAISIDVVTDYAFGSCYDLLKEPDLGLKFFTLVHKIGPAAWIFRQWPWLKSVAMSIPESIIKLISEPIGQVRDMQNHCHKQLLEVKANREAGLIRDDDRPTIFSALMDPKEGFSKGAVDNLEDEAYTVITAAADTTGNAMTTMVRCVVENSNIYRRLHAELCEAFPDPESELTYAALERLPYLTMVIKEGLRLSFGVPGRLPRVVPPGGATFNGYTLPEGTVVSMSSWILHQDQDFFPNPTVFDPDRWSDATEAQRMDKAFVPFGKGSRACVGMNLAYCELYVVIGTLFRTFTDLKGNHLTEEDLAYDDYFSSYNPLEATKFHVSKADKEITAM